MEFKGAEEHDLGSQKGSQAVVYSLSERPDTRVKIGLYWRCYLSIRVSEIDTRYWTTCTWMVTVSAAHLARRFPFHHS